MQTLSIRVATPTDIPALTHLWYEKTVLQHHADRRFTLAPDGQRQWSQAAHVWLADPQVNVFIAETDEAVVGYLVARVQPSPPGLLPERFGVVTELAVDAHGYHGGVGRGLYEAACDWLTMQGVRHVYVDVLRRHAVEQAFWRALGAKEWQDRLWMKL